MEFTTLEGLYEHPTNRLRLAAELQHLERAFGDSFCQTMKIPVLVANLVDAKLYQHRNHEMVICDVWERINGVYITEIMVKGASGEGLGTIGWELFDSKNIMLKAKTISKKMKRKDHIASGNFDRLCREYDTHFRPQSQISKAKELVSSTISQMKREHTNQMQKQRLVLDFVKSLVPHVMQNIDTFKGVAISNGFDPDDIEEAQTVWSNLMLVESVTGKCSMNDSGFFVHIEDDTCLVLDANKNNIGAHHSYELPDKIGKAVGMLKLTENCTFIRNVGYKYDPSTYFIAGEYNE